MEAKEKTLAMLEADLEAAKPFLRYMLEEFNACDEALEAIEEATEPWDIKMLIRNFKEDIAERIGVEVAQNMTMENVKEYLESHDLSSWDSEEIWPHLNIDLDNLIDQEDYLKYPESLVNGEKLKRFLSLIDDVSDADLDALTAK